MLKLFIVTTLDEWSLIYRRMSASQCSMCSGSLWPLMALMVILLAFLGANLFTAVLTYAYSHVLNRQHSRKKRLGDLARKQDGPQALAYMEDDMKAVAMHQLMSFNNVGLRYGPSVMEGRIVKIVDPKRTKTDGEATQPLRQLESLPPVDTAEDFTREQTQQYGEYGGMDGEMEAVWNDDIECV
jgi:hypothetical protein